MVGENLDLTNEPPESGKGQNGPAGSRPFLGVHFACCSVYARIYLNREGTAYLGNCPRCAKQVRFRVGPGGSDARFYTAY